MGKITGTQCEINFRSSGVKYISVFRSFSEFSRVLGVFKNIFQKILFDSSGKY
jgi:hypothetical protein